MALINDEIKKYIQEQFNIHYLGEHNPINADGIGIFGIAMVVSRNDGTNQGKVRISPIHVAEKTKRDKESGDIENTDIMAEVISPAKGENHGVYYTPEFGDFVLYTEIAEMAIILGSINNPSGKFAALNIPVEVQNIQANGKEYNNSHYPSLNTKGYHLDAPVTGSIYQPAAFLQRWRRNDFLIYNTTKIHENDKSAVKLMELRSAENQMLQLVDIGNNHIKPGIGAETKKNSKNYSPVRQTDYRDLWEGFNINREFWTTRTEFPAKPHESQYVKLSTNGHDYSEADHGDVASDLPELVRGEFRWDDRLTHGSHETSKTYCPIYQTVKFAKGEERYYQDKPAQSDWEAGVPYRSKVKAWIDDTVGMENDQKAQKFNIGHYLTLSNTIYKRRAMLSTKKGHQLVMSDIDKDEKILLNSHRGKHIYMEDSDKEHYDVMWMASQKHHMIYCDTQFSPYLIDDNNVERDRLLDPNQMCGSSYQLIQTEKKQKIWLADSPLAPRIHLHTNGGIGGHELLLLDHDMGVANTSPTPDKGKVQITTSDKLMQITLDVESGNLTIQNHNPGGLDIYSLGDLSIKTNGLMSLEADLGFKINSSDGMWIENTNQNITNSDAPEGPAAPTAILPSVLSDIDTTSGELVNKFKVS